MVGERQRASRDRTWPGGDSMSFERGRRTVALLAETTMTVTPLTIVAQEPEAPKAQSQATPSVQRAFNAAMPKSHNPFGAYMPNDVSEPVLANSPRLQQLVRDGKLQISLRDAIYLA